ncbi:MAG: arginine--tRNA ligase [Patescibacteria group bacterium]
MNIKEKIENWIKETLKIEGDFVLAHSKDLKNGDYSFFAPQNVNEFDQSLNENKIPEISEIKIAGNFINFYLSKEFFAYSVKEILKEKEKYGQNKLLDGQKIMVDYTDPNPFKEFHIGHLMSNAIGESVCRILDFNGAEVIRVCYQGDVGLQVAKAIWGILQNKKDFPKDDASLSEKIAYLGEAYVLGSQKYSDDKKATEEIVQINKKIFEKSNEEINTIYKKGREWSLLHFDEIYEKLGTKFDHIIPESSVIEDGQKIVEEFLDKGIFEKSDGAVVFRGENYGLHTRVFINFQGLPTYEAKDLGLAKKKTELEKNLDVSIIVTANEQSDYFKVVFKAISFIYPEYAKISKHLGHGILRFASGKMSSREGNVITGESLIFQVEGLVKGKVEDRDYSEKEKEEIIQKVAIGAIKYSILRQAIGGDIIFDFDKSISFEGDSGPYLQYACVRANSILEKAKVSRSVLDMSKMPFDTWKTTELERYLYRFPEVVERAGREYAPHYIVTYLTELASIFNSFYAGNKIIDENDPNSPYKITLTQAVAYILKYGLHLLGIKVPEKM